MFGDQFTENERKQCRGYAPPKKTPRMQVSRPVAANADATVVAVSCAGCSNMHGLTDLAKGYCIRCRRNWQQQSIDDRLPPTKSTIPESDPEPVHKKQKPSADSKKKTKKNSKKKNEEYQGDVDEATIAETNKPKSKKKKTKTEVL